MTGAMTAPARAGADLRLLRAAVFAAACVTLSAAGHEAASGAVIPVWALLAGWAGVFAVASVFAGRERSLPGIAALMLAGQGVLHLVFTTGQWCAEPVAAGAGRDRVMALAGRLVCGGGAPLRLTPGGAARLVRQAGIDPASASAVPGMSAGPGGAAAAGAHGCMGYTLPMLCGHLVAALVAGWLLRRGEAALWRVVRLSARGAGRLAARSPLRAAWAAVRACALVTGGTAAPDGMSVRRRVDDGAVRLPRSVVLRHSVVRRGPPRVALAA